MVDSDEETVKYLCKITNQISNQFRREAETLINRMIFLVVLEQYKCQIIPPNRTAIGFVASLRNTDNVSTGQQQIIVSAFTFY